MRQVLKTSRGCPITQMYLELGQIPARFQIKKMRLLFLKDILNQRVESMISKVFQLQLEQPSKGDWPSSCLKDLEELQLAMSFEEKKLISKNRFNKILNERIRAASLTYLTGKQNIKGGDINYAKIEMSEYLSPLSDLSIDDKRRLFAVRNMMVDIPANFSNSNENMKCICGEKESMAHIYQCGFLSTDKPKIEYEKIYDGSIHEQIEIFRKFENNLEIRNKPRNPLPCDPTCDPLYSVENSIG